uniref:hypothetical protein n=1 Tax=Pseudomonas veronii TaxID=76761 RepID=UPI003C7B7388
MLHYFDFGQLVNTLAGRYRNAPVYELPHLVTLKQQLEGFLPPRFQVASQCQNLVKRGIGDSTLTAYIPSPKVALIVCLTCLPLGVSVYLSTLTVAIVSAW